MERKYKIALIILGALLVASSIGIVIYQLNKDKNDEPDDTVIDENLTINEVNTGETNNTNDNDQLGGGGTSWSNEVTPVFNTENELSNPLNELKGRTLYPKEITAGGWGYANVRTSAEVNNDQGWWDPSDNLITTINSGSPIGTVISQTSGVYNGYAYKWYKVKLKVPTGGWVIDYTEGYARGDTVTFIPYTA